MSFVLLGAFVAYSSFRNQLRLNAETAANDEANDLFQIETASGNAGVRCLYETYGFDDPARCLAINTADSDSWAKAQSYVGEVLFVLHKAGIDERHWGSRYLDDIYYWREDVAADPTGTFAYTAISRRGVANAKTYLAEADPCIPRLCDNYERVRGALIAASALPATHVNRCAGLSAAGRTMSCNGPNAAPR